MAAGHLNGSDICAIIQKDERVCCLGLGPSTPTTNTTKYQVNISKSSADDENEKVNERTIETKADSLQISPSPTFDVKNWNGYRIGDGVRGILGSDRTKVCKRWPESLLCQYLTRTNQANNISVLADIVNHEWNNTSHESDNKKPSTATTVLHLRLGDGLCGQYDLVRGVGPGARRWILQESLTAGKMKPTVL